MPQRGWGVGEGRGKCVYVPCGAWCSECFVGYLGVSYRVTVFSKVLHCTDQEVELISAVLVSSSRG